MDKGVKNLLGFAIIIALVAFAYGAVKFVGAYSDAIEPSSFRSFQVSAEGKAVAIPDVAEFSFTTITQGGLDLAELQENNTEKMNNSISFVKEQGVEDKDIKTSNYKISPRYQYYSCPEDGGACPPPEIVGYKIEQTVSVKIHDFEKIGDVLKGVVNNGANDISRLDFRIDDPTKPENKARAEAIKKAKEKAKSIAEAGGFSLGRLLSISEGTVSPYYDNRQKIYFKATEEAGGSAAPSVEPGSQEVRVNVNLKYEIK